MESSDQEDSIRQEASAGGEDKKTREYRQRDPALNRRLEELFTKMRCPYCPEEKNITLKYKRNLKKDSHPEELEPIIKELATTKSDAQSKLPFNIVSTTNDPVRLLALYFGTSPTFPCLTIALALALAPSKSKSGAKF